jgi:2'-5' RNA ligase
MDLRLFCALPVPTVVETKLATTTRVLRGALPLASISWVKPDNFHLTLSFLGNVEQNRVEELTKRLQIACQEGSRFELICQGLGCFPNVNRPRVIWAGCQSKHDGLRLLQGRVAAACAPFVQREEKGHFHGHITLGRVRPGGSPSGDSLSREIQRYQETTFGYWEVNGVDLLCSDLSQGAPRYSVLQHFLLK